MKVPGTKDDIAGSHRGAEPPVDVVDVSGSFVTSASRMPSSTS
jgi:hypothetical protein